MPSEDTSSYLSPYSNSLCPVPNGKAMIFSSHTGTVMCPNFGQFEIKNTKHSNFHILHDYIFHGKKLENRFELIPFCKIRSLDGGKFVKCMFFPKCVGFQLSASNLKSHLDHEGIQLRI